MLQPARSAMRPVAADHCTDPRSFSRWVINHSSIEIDVMVYGQELTDLHPLVIVNSLELPMPPSQAFCDLMWQSGYQVIFIRRPGFGGAPGLPSALLSKQEVQNGAAVITEAALLHRLLETMGLRNIVLLGLGTSNSVCVRLCKLSANVRFAVFSNPLFHQDVWDIVRPRWMQSMVRQVMTSRGGLKFTVMGLKSTLKRNPLWFYRQFAQKSDGDVDYVAQNAPDFEEASQLLQNVTPETLYYDLQMAMVQDTNVEASFFRDVNGVILCGTETTEQWKLNIDDQAKRLSIPIIFAPSGDLFVAYVSSETLLEILDRNVPQVARG